MKNINGKESLGIELGSTRVKAVLIDENCEILAQGSCVWENRLENGIWTYSLERIVETLQGAFADLNKECEKLFGKKISSVSSLGISAMMHGYLAFDKNNNLLVPFRTWRNTITSEAAKILTEKFSFNIPRRWSVAHLYRAVLNNEPHLEKIDSFNTLAGFVHFLLCGEKVLGIGDASGMFPIDSKNLCYDKAMIEKFNDLIGEKYSWKIENLLPKIALAGENAGILSNEGAKLLDPSGVLQSGAIMCPPEGDAGTGMVATNSIKAKTGNVSAGTSIFSMVVLEKALDCVKEEIDIVTTPVGKDVAMVHCNNCSTNIDKWIGFLDDVFKSFGIQKSVGELYETFYASAVGGEKDCGGVTSIPLFSSEPVAHVDDAKPKLIREKDASFTLSNLARAEINSAFCTLKIGMEILEKAGVEIEYLNGHGGLFKTTNSGAKLMASALGCKINCLETAGEGGAWGMAILARFALENKISLEDYLEKIVFEKSKVKTEIPNEEDATGFLKYYNRFKNELTGG